MDSELKAYLDTMEKRIVASIADRMRQFESSVNDGMIVTNRMVDRHSYGLQEHEQWLRDHTSAIAKHREWLEEHEAIMRRVEHNLELLADLILKGRGSNGGSSEPEDQ